jgi:uncharacterized protein (TIGR04255 family)
MGRKMTNPPVYFVLAEIKFNSVLALESFIPKIQESFRKKGYPDFQRSALTTFNLNVAGAEPQSQVPAVQSARFVFSDMNKSSGFVLDQGSLSFSITAYDVFETFAHDLLKGLEFVYEAVGGLTYVDRIGVRYLDAIYPKKGENLTDFLNVSVHGVASKLNGDLVYTFSETRIKNNEIEVISRVVIQNGKIGFPADLALTPFLLPKSILEYNGPHAIADNDGFYSVREKFDFEVIRSKLFKIHDEIDNSFKASVTPKALEAWN